MNCETTVEKWTDAEADHFRKTARQCMNQHSYDHAASDPLNCMACALRETTRKNGPNVAGWGRLFVESQMPIPSHWRKAFEWDRVKNPNKRYTEALERSIATFGEPSFC